MRLFGLRHLSRVTSRTTSTLLAGGLLCLTAWGGCAQDAATPEDALTTVSCRVGAPAQIFSSDFVGVDSVSFEVQGQRSRELVALDDGLSLSVTQDGCDELRQQFELDLGKEAASWAEAGPLLAARLRMLGGLDQKLISFVQYAEAVASLPATFPPGEPANLAPGLTLQHYPVQSVDYPRWGLLFVQSFPEPEDAR